MNILTNTILIFALCSATIYPMQRGKTQIPLITAMIEGTDSRTIERMVWRNATECAQEVSEDNETALMLAIWHNHQIIIAPLIEAMSTEQLLARDNAGFSALDYAKEKENIHATTLLQRKLHIRVEIPEEWFE